MSNYWNHQHSHQPDETTQQNIVEQTAHQASAESAPITILPIDQVKAGQFQPRTHFDQEQLQILTESIAQKGVLQPILVRPLPEGGYEIIAGERRYRAAQKADLTTIPVVVKDLSDREALEIGLIENLHREDLSPIDEAQGYKNLIEKFGYTQDSLARMLSKSPGYISQVLRLFDLPYIVQFMVHEGKLSFSHARLLVGIENAKKIAKKIVSKNLGVRETERLIAHQKKRHDNYKAEKKENDDIIRQQIKEIQTQLSSFLDLKIQVLHAEPSGKLVLHYKDWAEFGRILRSLAGQQHQLLSNIT